MQTNSILSSSSKSELISKFIQTVNVRNENTARQYYSRLLIFQRFVLKEHYYNNNNNNNKKNNKKLNYIYNFII